MKEKIDELKEQIEYRDALKYTLKQLISFKNSDYKIDLDIKFDDEEYGRSSTPLYFDRFDEDFAREFLELNIKFFNDKLRNADITLENMIK